MTFVAVGVCAKVGKGEIVIEGVIDGLGIICNISSEYSFGRKDDTSFTDTHPHDITTMHERNKYPRFILFHTVKPFPCQPNALVEYIKARLLRQAR